LVAFFLSSSFHLSFFSPPFKFKINPNLPRLAAGFAPSAASVSGGKKLLLSSPRYHCPLGLLTLRLNFPLMKSKDSLAPSEGKKLPRGNYVPQLRFPALVS